MPERSAAAFLAATGWAEAARAPLAGDASSRRYERLTRPDGVTAVLMDAPPGRGENTDGFLAIARYLTGHGFSAPAILAADPEAGYVLLEDLGDALFARLLAREPTREAELYAAATDVLLALQVQPPPPGLQALDETTLPALAVFAFDWYLAGATGEPPKTALRHQFLSAAAEAVTRHATAAPVFVHRDFHAENLLWLPDRQGTARVGLLDFQDARTGHPGFDLVSLLEDARRDVSEPTRAGAIRRVLDATGRDETRFAAALATLGALRNLRILGVFARLSLHGGKSSYLDLMPRVWAHLERDLAHPALAGLARAAAPLPPPTRTIIEKLRERCGTILEA